MPHAAPANISTPNIFEITGLLSGHDELTLICDNSYPGWPHDGIVQSSAATDETQTNWNGVIGYIRLRVEEPVYVQAVRVYPHGDQLDVCAAVDASQPWAAAITLTSDALAAPAAMDAKGGEGVTEIWLHDLPLAKNIRRWDEDEGNLYELTAVLNGQHTTVRFGVRDFGRRDNHLILNGRSIFIRGEANCCVFPETGHPPMTVEEWRQVLRTYRSYGVNCMRFHSHCPPEAAFTAADEMGMLMQPELSHWNPQSAFAAQECRDYYRAELQQILLMLANHPSFVMLTLGNELWMDEDGRAYCAVLTNIARRMDPTRLYATGSNNHYGRKQCDDGSDFQTSMAFGDLDTRAIGPNRYGWLNNQYPDMRKDYAEAAAAVKEQGEQPIFSFEVGQFEVLPDFDELEDYHGVTEPVNIRIIRQKADKRGLLPRWKQLVEATGELSVLCYRAEIEAALRTDGYSGISLLGLQDFPGQGTALVGMLNPHLQAKPYPFAQPERFSAFFTGTLPLVLLPRYTYTSEDTLEAVVRMANYGKTDLQGEAVWTLQGADVSLCGAFPQTVAPAGGLTTLGPLNIRLSGVKQAVQLELTVEMCGCRNQYPVWVYPPVQPVCPDNVYECRSLDDRALAVLAAGGTVYLAPASTREALPQSIQGQFSTDFWSVGTFPGQDGGMGQLIDVQHPIFRDFPTQFHTNWQWWPMAGQRAVILPRDYDAIITELDSYAYMRPMAQLLECRCNGGRLMISSMGLQDLLKVWQDAYDRYQAAM